MTGKEIQDDINEKLDVLKWLLNNKETDINRIGKIMKFYYSDKDALLKAVQKGVKTNKIL